MEKITKVLLLGSGALKIGEARISASLRANILVVNEARKNNRKIESREQIGEKGKRQKPKIHKKHPLVVFSPL